jgi:hypothetical protein
MVKALTPNPSAGKKKKKKKKKSQTGLNSTQQFEARPSTL